MSGTWATALELCGLPGLSSSERITRQLLLLSGVPSRSRAIGKGRPPLEFDCTQLPEPARTAFSSRDPEIGMTLATRAPARAREPGTAASRRSKGRPAKLTPEIERVMLAVLGHRSAKSAAFLRDAVSRQLDVPISTLPDARTFQRWARQLKERHADALLSIHDPEGFRSRRKAAFGSMSAAYSYANEEWQADGTRSDVTLIDGRWTVMGLLDLWTRRVMFLVAQAEDTAAFKALMRRAILAWGWPERIKVDQGSAFISLDTSLTLEQLKIEHVDLPPGSPDRKPFVERCFRTVQHDWLEMLPGYSGHSVAEASKLRARARSETGRPEILGTLTRDELQRALDTWSRDIYAKRIHSGTGEAPEARAARSEPARPPMDIRELDRLLNPLDGLRTVSKSGLKVQGSIYISAELGRHVGRTVQVRRDATDMGTAYVFDADGLFLCEAHNALMEGIDREALAREARRLQMEELARGRATVRAAVRAVDPEQLAMRVLQVKAEPAPVAQLPVKPRTPVDKGEDRISLLRDALTRCLAVAARLESGAQVDPHDAGWARTWIASSAARSIIDFLVGRGELPANWQPPASIQPSVAPEMPFQRRSGL